MSCRLCCFMCSKARTKRSGARRLGPPFLSLHERTLLLSDTEHRARSMDWDGPCCVNLLAIKERGDLFRDERIIAQTAMTPNVGTQKSCFQTRVSCCWQRSHVLVWFLVGSHVPPPKTPIHRAPLALSLSLSRSVRKIGHASWPIAFPFLRVERAGS
jgi:hypothetical protein